MSGQNDSAAERSADVIRMDAHRVLDTRPAFWVELVDAQGKVRRQWLTRFEQDADAEGLTLRIRKRAPGEGVL